MEHSTSVEKVFSSVTVIPGHLKNNIWIQHSNDNGRSTCSLFQVLTILWVSSLKINSAAHTNKCWLIPLAVPKVNSPYMELKWAYHLCEEPNFYQYGWHQNKCLSTCLFFISNRRDPKLRVFVCSLQDIPL